MDMLTSQIIDRLERQRTASNDLFLNPARLVDVLVLDVQYGIDAALALQRPKTMLPAPSCEPAPVAGRYRFQVQLRRPPSGDAVFELEPRSGVDAVAAFRDAGCIRDGHLEVSRLLEV